MENAQAETKPSCCGSTVWIPRAGLFIFLFVLMRMTVGWHFLFEGIAKIYSTYTPKPFSSAGYFRESPGPMKSLMGSALPPDPDKVMVKRLDPAEIQEALRKVGEDFASNLGLTGPEKAKVLDLVEKQVKDALSWREGGNPQTRFAFEKALTAWERGGTEDLKKQALDKRLNLIALLREFQVRQGDLANQVTAFSGPIPKLNFPNPDPARLDRIPLDLTDPSNIAQVRSSLLAEAEKVMLDPWKGKTEPLAVEQWKKWDKVVAIADKWADATQEWLTSGEETLEEPSPDGKGSGTLKKVISTPDRVQRYESLVAKKEELLNSDKNWLFRKDVEKGALAAVRASAASARTSLGTELDKFKTDLVAALEKQFADQIAKAAPVKVSKEVKPIEILDFMTIWGITAIGAGLFTGTLTRMAALAGAAFLAMTYLAVPAFPWLPAPPQNEGNYVFVNKNVVEMMALLVIAAAPSGHWFGGDAVLAWLFGSRSGGSGSA